MTIQIYPYKLSKHTLEAHLKLGVTLSPGQLLRFETKTPIYGQVYKTFSQASKAPGMPEGHSVRIRLLHGCPVLAPQTVSLILPEDMSKELKRLQGPLAESFQIGKFEGALTGLGTLTVVESTDFTGQYELLVMLVKALSPHRKIVLIDPVGLLTAAFLKMDSSDIDKNIQREWTHFKAGEDFRLSVCDVGVTRFLNTFGALFSPLLQKMVLQDIAEMLPLMSHFLPFHRLLDADTVGQGRLKNLVLQEYQLLKKTGIFAEKTSQVLELMDVLGEQLSILDLSKVEDPWKGLYYEMICRDLWQYFVRQETPEKRSRLEFIPILVNPQAYLSAVWPDWLEKANETGLNLIVTGSSQTMDRAANNRIRISSEGQAEWLGSVTLNLPVYFTIGYSTPRESESTELTDEDESFTDEDMVLTDEEESFIDEDMVLTDEEESFIDEDVVLTDEADSVEDKDQLLTTQEELFLNEDSDTDDEEESYFGVADESLEDEMSFLGEDLESFNDEESFSEEDSSSVPGKRPLEKETISLSASMQLVEEDEGSSNSFNQNWTEYSNEEDEKWLSSWNIDEDEPEDSLLASSSQHNITDLSNPLKEPSLSFLTAEQLSDLLGSSTPNTEKIEEEIHAKEPDIKKGLPFEEEETSETGRSNGSSLQSSHKKSMDETILARDSEEEFSFDDDFDFDLGLVPAPMPDSSDQEVFQGSDDPFLETTARPSQGSSFGFSEASNRPTSNPISLDKASSSDTASPDQNQSTENHNKLPENVFKPGDRVYHPTYGAGQVQRVIPIEDTIILNILFDSVGKRLLDPNLTQLFPESVVPQTTGG